MAKRRIAAGELILFLLIRLLPGFSIFWQEAVSLPLLKVFVAVGMRLPFALLEWAAISAGIMLAWSLVCRHFLKRLLALALALLSAYLCLWYPLYFREQPVPAASSMQLALLCEQLIDELNAAPPDFSVIPPLPAKTARFPGWMRVLGISGFCSFFTGEAVVSPELHPAALPFTAVHEAMHLRGIAGEGAANIAAYEFCMERGGVFAASARLWALRCGMGMLFENDQTLYADCMQRMHAGTRQLFRDCGGSYRAGSPPPVMQWIYRVLGIEIPARDYEILAPYLAAGFRE